MALDTFVLWVNADSDIQTLEDWVATVKASGGEWKMGGTGTGQEDSLVTAMLEKEFDIKHAFLSTIHGYTADQSLVDGMHKSMTRARAAAINIIPASTGAAKAIGLVYPELAGKLHGAAMRVPVADGSVCDLTFVASRESSIEELKEAFVKAANGDLEGILRATDEPLVSTDIIGETCSSVVDLALIAQVAPTFFRVVSWYDNENAYALRCVDLLEYMVSNGIMMTSAIILGVTRKSKGFMPSVVNASTSSFTFMVPI